MLLTSQLATVLALLLFFSTTVALSQIAETCSPQEREQIKSIVGSEELILELTPRLRALDRAAMNLKIPSGNARQLFDANAHCNTIGRLQDTDVILSSLDQLTWNVAGDTVLVKDGVWSAFMTGVDFFESAKFYFVDASLNDEKSRLSANMGFKANCRLTNGKRCMVRAKMKVLWAMAGSHRDAIILDWQTTHFSTLIGGNELLFRDVTGDVIFDSALAEDLSRSRHEEITVNLIRGETVKRRPDDSYPFFFPEVTLEHPAVSIVDIDRDGFEDFFLGRHHQPSLMFRNRGDGTFEEIGEEIGLRLPYDCTCSLFADFDNDGDPDVFVGRARYRARYYENNNGKFVDKTRTTLDGNLPFMTSAISAADYNLDGLLDVYFSTYSPIEGSHGIVRQGQGRVWPAQFLDDDQRREFERRLTTSSAFFDVPGPPNLLLQNDGSAFRVAACNAHVQSWRKTFQSMWTDYDSDGDPDLYVCNDFGPDDLYRNDNGRGFVRVNQVAGLTQLGFGMGVAGEDYDRDGDLDLYVSNMYSKAGTRITRQISQINPLLSQMAAGNYLYNFHDGKFELVSLREGSQPAVAISGWSWGGRMVDIDNDGKHEIFVANGYYSAPQAVAEQMDL